MTDPVHPTLPTRVEASPEGIELAIALRVAQSPSPSHVDRTMSNMTDSTKHHHRKLGVEHLSKTKPPAVVEL